MASTTDYIMELINNMPKPWDRVLIRDDNGEPTIKAVILEATVDQSVWKYKVAIEERIVDPTALGAMNTVRTALHHHMSSAIAAAQAALGATPEPGVVVNENTTDSFWDYQIHEVIGKMSIEEGMMHPNSIIRDLAVIKFKEQQKREEDLWK